MVRIDHVDGTARVAEVARRCQSRSTVLLVAGNAADAGWARKLEPDSTSPIPRERAHYAFCEDRVKIDFSRRRPIIRRQSLEGHGGMLDRLDSVLFARFHGV